VPPTAGNAWTLSTGIQSAVGTPNTTGHMKQTYTDGFGPRAARTFFDLAETDATRMAGDPVVVSVRVEGESGHYLRPEQFHRDAHLLMGQTTSSGTTNYTHTATSTTSGSAPYATLIRALNATTLVEQMNDVQLSSLTVNGAAEAPITYTKTWVGRTALEGATDTALTPATSVPYTYPEVTVTKNSVTTDIVTSFSITANQNRSLVFGDSSISAAATVAGQFAVTGSLAILFESDADYRLFQTGSTSGTIPGTTITAQPLTILIQRDANTSVSFAMTNVILTAYDPPANTDGAPIIVGADFRSKRGATLGDVLTIVTKNQVATVTT
jgi:hypothetical protein